MGHSSDSLEDYGENNFDKRAKVAGGSRKASEGEGKAGLKSSKTKNVVDTNFVAESPEGFKKRLVTAANQQVPSRALVCWGQRKEEEQVFSDDSELAARNELLNKPLPLYNMGAPPTASPRPWCSLPKTRSGILSSTFML